MKPDSTYQDTDNNELLQRARDGDQGAFNDLFLKHRAELRRFVDLRLDPRVRTRVDASDIIQDTHIEAFRRFNNFFDRKPMPFAIWLRKNAYERLLNVQRDHIATARRSINREHRLPDASSVMIYQFAVDQNGSPSERLLEKEFQRRVADTMAELPEADRELLLLRNVEGMSHQDIGYLLDITSATARKRYARALIKLEALLIKNGVVE